MKVRLHVPVRKPAPNPAYSHINWTHSFPFAANPRGILIHRVKAVKCHTVNGQVRHGSCDYWCDNSCCFWQDIFVEVPPEGRILCARCEFAALQAGEMAADEIVGRHVHVGGIRAYRTCCQDKPSN